MAKKHKLEDVSEPIQVKKPRVIIAASQQTIEQPRQSHNAADTASLTKSQPISATSPQEPEVQEPSEILPNHLMPLVQKYSFAKITIKTNSKIKGKVQNLLKHMAHFSFADQNPKPGVIVIDAKASDATKMLSVIEIAKREIEAEKRAGKWFQYSRVRQEITRIPRRPKGAATQANGKTQDQAAAKSTGDGKATAGSDLITEDKDVDTKIRAIPVLMIYMSRVTIPELKQEYGEQTNSTPSRK